MKEDFVLLKRIKSRLWTAGQWLEKTAEGDPRFKDFGRWSRWRKEPNPRRAGFELLETHIDLPSLAQRIGVFDPAIEKLRR